ncbi:MAG: thioredoxin domain-containing protein [Vagococcus sp.]|uniref:thioredoxin domain-containing protein n=1 Tax=Vagococcus sp. TaxID=1933889 RepID=UPI002FCACCD1
MGMTEVDVTKINPTTGIKIGDDKAPIKVIEFVNLRCPFCRLWSDEKDTFLQQYVEEGKIQRVIKLFDKEKPSLAKGNIMHHHVPNNDLALSAIQSIYETQDDWGDLEDHNEIAAFATDRLNLSLQDFKDTSESIINEAEAANVVFVPTVIIGEHVFDQKISIQELKAILDN